MILMKNALQLLILTGMLWILSDKNVNAEKIELSRFISPQTCGDCHSEIYEQWSNSMHNLAHKDFIYRRVAEYTLHGTHHKDERAEAESCVKCHIPIGVLANTPSKTSEDTLKASPPAGEAIQCDYCHSTVKIEKMYNNGIVVEPGHGEDDPGIKRGPYKDSESDFHETKFSRLHTESAFCGTCHNVKHVVFGTDLETTYDEWKNSPYNSKNPLKRVTCQGCHMYQRPGVPATGMTKRPENPGLASDDGPERAHVFTHYFIGGNNYIPGSFKDIVKTGMADERLKHAATLSIDASSLLETGKFIVKVINSGAGHYLPTGLTEVRQVWLEIIVLNNSGKTIYVSGEPDLNGYLSENTVVFNTVLGDGKGNPVISVAKAKEILKDLRIPPLKSYEKKILIPKQSGNIKCIKARLKYRIAPQKTVDTLFGKGKYRLPVTVMAETELKI